MFLQEPMLTKPRNLHAAPAGRGRGGNCVTGRNEPGPRVAARPGDPRDPWRGKCSRAKDPGAAATVARLEADGVLHDPALRAALLQLRREVLMPRAYVRRNSPGMQPRVWQLLDSPHPDDREEWLQVLPPGRARGLLHPL